VTVYQIIDLEVHNPDLYARYVDKVSAIVQKHGGCYLARGGKVTALGGDWQPARLVLIEFESLEKLQQCYASPEYQAITPLRERSTRSKAIIVEGVL